MPPSKRHSGWCRTNGRFVIERAYPRKKREADYEIRAYAEELRGDKKALAGLPKRGLRHPEGQPGPLCGRRRRPGRSWGIGLPDIPLFAGVILKSVYEIAVNYGFSYEEEEGAGLFTEGHRGGSLRQGDLHENKRRAGRVDRRGTPFFRDGRRTRPHICGPQALSRRLLYMKFIQGIPRPVPVEACRTPVCLKEILAFADLKYQGAPPAKKAEDLTGASRPDALENGRN